jgi:hypothetical protein
MAKDKFVEHRFSSESAALIAKTAAVLDDYRSQGYVMTLRQVYYQMIGRDLFPDAWIDRETGTKNNIKNYKKFGVLVSDARLAGLLDWGMIEDRGREVQVNSHWKSPAHIMRACAEQFSVDRWEGQENYVEVFVEKDALSGILLPVCSELDVRFTANKGYSSSSAMYEAAARLALASNSGEYGKEIHIIYLGDHDPSGIDMTGDIERRFALFTRESFDINIHRLALNMDQVEMWQPPENPAKETDSRFAKYRDEFGDKSWELDAVEPATLADLVREKIEELIDNEQWDIVSERESEMRSELKEMADAYERKQK